MTDNTIWLKTRAQRLNKYLEDVNYMFCPKERPDITMDGNTCTITFECTYSFPVKTAKVTVRFEDVEFPFGTTVDVYTTIDGHTNACNRDIADGSTNGTVYNLLMQTKEDMRVECGGKVPYMVLECLRRIKFREILGFMQYITVKEVFEEAAKELNRLKIPEIEVWLGGFPEEVRIDVLRYAVDRRYRLEDGGWDEFNKWLVK